MPRAVPAADLLVGDQLQRDRIGQPGGQLAEDLGGQQAGQLHVLGAAGEQAVAVAARPELARRSRDDVQVGVEDDVGSPGVPARVDQGARLAAGLEPLDREPRADEVEDVFEGPPELARLLAGRRDGQQLTGTGEEQLSIHDSMVTLGRARPARHSCLAPVTVFPSSRGLLRPARLEDQAGRGGMRVEGSVGPGDLAGRGGHPPSGAHHLPRRGHVGVLRVSALTRFTFSSSVV